MLSAIARGVVVFARARVRRNGRKSRIWAGQAESCVVEQPGSRSPLAVSLDAASRATTIGLEFALPAAAGYYLDRRIGSLPAATVCGVILGFAVGMLHAVRMSRQMFGQDARLPQKPGPPGPDRGSDEPGNR